LTEGWAVLSAGFSLALDRGLGSAFRRLQPGACRMDKQRFHQASAWRLTEGCATLPAGFSLAHAGGLGKKVINNRITFWLLP